MNVLQGLKDFEPTKSTLGWVAAGASVLTIIVGFTFGGWTTGGTTSRMVNEARTAGQTDIAAAVCLANFRQAPTARANHAELAGLTLPRQRQFVIDQAWAQVPGAERVNRAVAELCARNISQMDPEELGEPADA
jgi:hypothetical protein